MSFCFYARTFRSLKPRLLLLSIATLFLIASPVSAAIWSSTAAQLEPLAPLLELHPGSTVAEIGAGTGAVSIAAARQVGPTGHVFATEIDPEQVQEIRKAVSDAGLSNVTVIQSTASETGLPAGCCDAVFMIGVYHHFTDPMAVDASIFRALRPGGRLVIQDFRPAWIFKPWTPEGVPANRGGHGIPENILEDELSRSGFKLEHAYDKWGSSWILSNYCVVFEKPVETSNASR